MRRSAFRALVKTPMQESGVWKTIVIDPNARSCDDSKPAFMAPPPGSGAYYGFPLIEETQVDGWRYGAVTDPFEADSPDGCTIGDGFAETPDGQRAGLIWSVDPNPRFAVIEGPSSTRWGLFHFTVPQPIAAVEDLQDAFQGMVPVLEHLRQRFLGSDG